VRWKDVWTWTAIEVDTTFYVSYPLGKRTSGRWTSCKTVRLLLETLPLIATCQCRFSVAGIKLVEKVHADTHEFAPFKPFLLGLLRVPAMFEQRETNPVSSFWCLRPCTQASVQSASSISHSWAAAKAAAPCLCAAFLDCTQIPGRVIVLQPSAAPFMGYLHDFHSPPPGATSPILVTLPTIAWPPWCT
jgi:hypothetical protein